MKIENIEAAEITISVIKQAQSQIENYNRLKDFNEISIVANDDIFNEIRAAMKKGRYSKEKPTPMFFSGKTKDLILDILIQNKQEFLDGRILQLEKY